MKKLIVSLLATFLICAGNLSQAADEVPSDVQMPGTQPEDNIGSLQTANRCDNCHGGYDPANEPAHNWNGSVMAHAAADPLYWATVAIAEQDFDGAGDLCLRCHNPAGWLAGRSTPTDGSSLSQNSDTDGIECDLCHRLTNPDQSDGILGVQNEPFIAKTGTEGHYGSGQYVMWDENSKLGPYDDAEARHQSLKSPFYRSSDLCGTCHDVSNPVVGDLAPNHGAQVPLAAGTFSGVPGTDRSGKAAFNNPPYKYGVVERTYSEHMASAFPTTPVSAFNSLPSELQASGGSIGIAYSAAMAGGNNGNYEDGTVRNFTCQTCHMPPAAGAQGCNKNPRPRPDMPRHDLTGGNFWMMDVLQDMDAKGNLVLGGDYTSNELAAMADGKIRAMANLTSAASLSVDEGNDTVTVTNLTGHKLISGYPEGRRMWLNVKWYNDTNTLVREDGEYGDLVLDYDIDGNPGNDTVQTILDADDPNTRIYEAHAAITQAWAAKLLGVFPEKALLPVAFNRVTGTVETTLGDVRDNGDHESFHFALNNKLIKDSRIPPYGMDCVKARERNILPVVDGMIDGSEYGVTITNGNCPSGGAVFNHYDAWGLNPPTGAVYATIELKYQSTSWEYIQFLHKANNGSVAFLADTGTDMLDGWLSTGMAEPFLMASAEWGTPPTGGNCTRNAPDFSMGNDQSIDVNGQTVYTLNITNRDTAACTDSTFNLNLSETDANGSFSLPSDLSATSVTLAAGASTSATLTVTGNGNGANGDFLDSTVEVRDDANHSGQQQTDTVRTTIQAAVCTRNAPSFTMGEDETITTSGSAVYTLDITNNDTDCAASTFNLNLSETGATGSFTQPSDLSASSVTLAAGARDTSVTLTVTGNGNGADGDFLDSSVEVRDDTDHATQQQTDTVRTTLQAAPPACNTWPDRQSCRDNGCKWKQNQCQDP